MEFHIVSTLHKKLVKNLEQLMMRNKTFILPTINIFNLLPTKNSDIIILILVRTTTSLHLIFGKSHSVSLLMMLIDSKRTE